MKAAADRSGLHPQKAADEAVLAGDYVLDKKGVEIRVGSRVTCDWRQFATLGSCGCPSYSDGCSSPVCRYRRCEGVVTAVTDWDADIDDEGRMHGYPPRVHVKWDRPLTNGAGQVWTEEICDTERAIDREGADTCYELEVIE